MDLGHRDVRGVAGGRDVGHDVREAAPGRSVALAQPDRPSLAFGLPRAPVEGEKIRPYVLNTGPSKWSAFHVIGTVFDKAVIEGTTFRDSQTMNLAPSQGGYAEFTLDQEGSYPFVTHAFGDMVKGAAGMLKTTNAPAPADAGTAADHT